MLIRDNQIYSDILAAKDIIARVNLEYNPRPEELVWNVFNTGLSIREKLAFITVLYTGDWQDSFYGPAFMMPATRDCIEQYPNVKKNLGKKLVFKKHHYEPDEKEWEGFIYLSFQNYRRKKTA